MTDMAKRQESYPEAATNGAQKTAVTDNSEALQEALAAHGEELADFVEGVDELDDALTTAILIAASADTAELDHITSSAANLIEAVDSLSTEEATELAAELGDNADDLSASLDLILGLQREGHLEGFVTVATAFGESFSAAEIEKLSTMLEENGTKTVEALDVVLALQQEGHLDDLLELAKTLSVLEIDGDAAEGLNTLLGAVGAAQRGSKPVGLVGLLGQLRNSDVRAGLGYIVTVLKALGRQLRAR